MWSDQGLRRLGTAVLVGVTAAVLLTEPAVDQSDADPLVLDPFVTTAAEVETFRATGAQVACRLSAAWNPRLPDAGRFPPAALGPATGDGTGERWLRPAAWPEYAEVLADRLRLCRDKGFDAVLIQGDDSFRDRATTLADRLRLPVTTWSSSL